MQDFISKRVRVFRNGDIFTPAKKFVVSPRVYRNFEQVLKLITTQFLLGVSKDIKLINGAVRKVYDIDGKLVRGLEDLVEGGVYVATGGELFKRAPYLLKEQNENLAVKPRKHFASNRMFLASDTTNRKETPIFTTTSKAYRVTVYANGDSVNAGIRLLLNHRTCKKFEQLLRLISDVLRLQAGSVRKIYDIKTGKQVTQLRELYDGQQLAGSVTDHFRRVVYKPRTAMDNGQSHKEEEERRIITFYQNGDSHHTGYIIPLNSSKFPTYKKLIDFINKKYKLVNGLVGRICTMTGETIESVNQLEHGNSYVLVCGNDAFCAIKYNVNRAEMRGFAAKGMAGYTRNNKLMDKIKVAKEVWETSGWKAKENARKNGLGKKSANQAAEEIQEEEAVADAIGDDQDDVYESQELGSFNPVEVEDPEIDILENDEPELNDNVDEIDDEEEFEDEAIGDYNSKLVDIDADEGNEDPENDVLENDEQGEDQETEEFEQVDEENEAEEDVEENEVEEQVEEEEADENEVEEEEFEEEQVEDPAAEQEESQEDLEELDVPDDSQESLSASQKFSSVPELPSRDQSNSQSLSRIPVKSVSSFN